ncbi:MAG: hypothetical protein AB2794_21245 [Candidatus Thiodiazotropha endolucinida]
MKKKYKDWLMVQPWKEQHSKCPSCGESNLEYYLVGDASTRIGWCMLWCASCKEGIQISRMKLPEGVEFIPYEKSVSGPSGGPEYAVNWVQP